jgi:hypothetical protein
VSKVQRRVSQNFSFADPFWLRHLTTGHHIPAHVTEQRPDKWYPKLKIYISELILDSKKDITAAYVTTRRMI